MNGLDSALNRLRRVLLIVYALALVTSVSVFLVLDYFHHQKMAASFALSARSSLVINDIRQGIVTLNPAASNGFDLVQFRSSDDRLVFSLPVQDAESISPLSMQFIEPVLLDPQNPASAKIGSLIFAHVAWNAVGGALIVWFSLLLLGIPISTWAKRMIVARHEELLAMSNAETKAAIAKQLAHDIRSPLSALMIIEKTHKGFSDDQHNLFVSAAERIQKIAADLLETNAGNDSATADVAKVVEQIIEEKQIQLGSDSRIKILKPELVRGAAAIPSAVFARVFSNHLNNAVESIEGSGTVTIRSSNNGAQYKLSLEDTGKGIPADRLAALGKTGLKSDKAGGSGLGLAHAIESVKKSGGNLKIQSTVGKGTLVEIFLPK